VRFVIALWSHSGAVIFGRKRQKIAVCPFLTQEVLLITPDEF